MPIVESVNRLRKALDRLDRAADSLETRHKKQKNRINDLEGQLATLLLQRQKQDEKKIRATTALDEAIEQLTISLEKSVSEESDALSPEELEEKSRRS